MLARRSVNVIVVRTAGTLVSTELSQFWGYDFVSGGRAIKVKLKHMNVVDDLVIENLIADDEFIIIISTNITNISAAGEK
jgi:hypothetical protein